MHELVEIIIHLVELGIIFRLVEMKFHDVCRYTDLMKPSFLITTYQSHC